MEFFAVALEKSMVLKESDSAETYFSPKRVLTLYYRLQAPYASHSGIQSCEDDLCILHKNQTGKFGYYTVVSKLGEEYHYGRDSIGKQVFVKPSNLCEIPKLILSNENP
jgi:hypothetical protein